MYSAVTSSLVNAFVHVDNESIVPFSKDGELVEALPFFEDIKDELYKLTMNYFIDEEAYHYDKWILPLLRDNRIKELGI